jgi:hypothetical protein
MKNLLIYNDILFDIFEYLSPFDLNKIQKVSKKWKKISNSKLLWKKFCLKIGYKDSYNYLNKKKITSFKKLFLKTLFFKWDNLKKNNLSINNFSISLNQFKKNEIIKNEDNKLEWFDKKLFKYIFNLIIILGFLLIHQLVSLEEFIIMKLKLKK